MRTFDYRNLDERIWNRKIVQLLTAIKEHQSVTRVSSKQIPQVLDKLVDIAKIQSTSASNAIEGIRTTEKRLKGLVEKTIEPRTRDEEEIAGYRFVLDTIHQDHDLIPPTANMILQLHRDLFRYSPVSDGGQFKRGDNIIEEQTVDGQRRVRFKPPSAGFVPEMLNQLTTTFLEEMNRKEVEPLLLIGAFIFDFVSIHPFRDGNGRLSRLLTLLLLYRSHYTVGKYISIEAFIEKTKDAYYDTLLASSQGWHEGTNDYRPFITYYLSIILAAYKEFSTRVSGILDQDFNKQERVEDVFKTKLGKITKQDIHLMHPDISVKTIEKTISLLLKAKRIDKFGQGKNTYYLKKPSR